MPWGGVSEIHLREAGPHGPQRLACDWDPKQPASQFAIPAVVQPQLPSLRTTTAAANKGRRHHQRHQQNGTNKKEALPQEQRV